MGDGEIGDRIGVMTAKVGRVDCEAVEMLKLSFGFIDREASMLKIDLVVE